MNNKLIIEGDNEISIQKITQWAIYSGLLEGMPTTRMNKQILEDSEREAKKMCGFNNVYVIIPQETPIPYEGKYQFGNPASLPGVICIAILRSAFAFRDKTKDISMLGLVWFQKDYAFPIEPDILNKIKAIPFSTLCVEFEL
jgi:hypothetical protein